MKLEKGLGPVKRFGVRYGRTVKARLAKIEIEQKKPQLCPYCEQPKAKKLFAGVYLCKKCGAKFTGRAFFLTKPEEAAEEEDKKTKKEKETEEEKEEETEE
ncbi:MAG: 50S ribosomal protein L37ae [Candidatus Woesearchaeota archaeon]